LPSYGIRQIIKKTSFLRPAFFGYFSA